MEYKFNNLIDENASPTDFIEPNYPGQFPEQMPIYLELDLDETPPTVTVETYNFQMHGTPADIWHARRLVWALPANTDASKMHDWVNETLGEALNNLIEGASIEWDGNNYVGVFDDTAQSVKDALDWQFQCTGFSDFPFLEYGGLLDVESYFENDLSYPDEDDPEAKIMDHIITADTTDDELDTIALDLNDYVDDVYVLIGTTRELVGQLRDECEQYK